MPSAAANPYLDTWFWKESGCPAEESLGFLLFCSTISNGQVSWSPGPKWLSLARSFLKNHHRKRMNITGFHWVFC